MGVQSEVPFGCYCVLSHMHINHNYYNTFLTPCARKVIKMGEKFKDVQDCEMFLLRTVSLKCITTGCFYFKKSMKTLFAK